MRHNPDARAGLFRRVRVMGVAAAAVLAGGTLTALSGTQIAHAGPAGPPWVVVSSPDTSVSQDNGLEAVSCTALSACAAVGEYNNGSNLQTLVEMWNGTSWSIVPSPNSSSSQDNTLDAVSCSGPATSAAVGDYNNGSNLQTLVEMWNGTSWSIVPSPNSGPLEANDLAGVSCSGPAACVAVGNHSNGTQSQTLVEMWNGTSWSIVPSPNTSPAQRNFLEAVSCTGSSACMAVGDYNNGTNIQTLAESWNGATWSIVPSPSTSPSEQNDLQGVSCTGPSTCMAVGYYSSGTIQQTLVEAWNGASWSIVPSPNITTTQRNALSSVSCTGPSACTAVGDGSSLATLVETWDGTSWSIVPSPRYTSQLNDIDGVSCIEASSIPVCTAVGYHVQAVNQQTMVMAQLVGGVTPIGAGPGTGYRLVASDGGLFSFSQPFFGSMGGKKLNKPVIGMAVDPLTGGYWEVASDGGIFAFNAPFYGSMGGIPAQPTHRGHRRRSRHRRLLGGGLRRRHLRLQRPVLRLDGRHAAQRSPSSASPPTLTGGYWEVASDGGIFAFNAPFYGSMGGPPLNQPVVGIAADPDTGGYWEVASDGGLFAFERSVLRLDGRHAPQRAGRGHRRRPAHRRLLGGGLRRRDLRLQRPVPWVDGRDTAEHASRGHELTTARSISGRPRHG